jgi:hypothetical protein
MAQKRSDGTILMIDGTAAIIIDEGPHPVIVTTWFGEATVPIVDEYYGWLGPRMAKARASGERLVLLNDTFAVERPTPMVRKRLADKTSAQNKEDGKAMIGSVVVVENVLIRGAVTALGWILPSLSESDFVGTLEEGIDRCFAILAREEVRTPSNLRGYRRPARP